MRRSFIAGSGFLKNTEDEFKALEIAVSTTGMEIRKYMVSDTFGTGVWGHAVDTGGPRGGALENFRKYWLLQ